MLPYRVLWRLVSCGAMESPPPPPPCAPCFVAAREPVTFGGDFPHFRIHVKADDIAEPG